MPDASPLGPVLDAERLSLHQQIAFATDESLVEALSRSAAFRIDGDDEVVHCEWVRRELEEEPTPFAFGRVSVSGHEIVIESFSESWLHELVREVRGLGAGGVARDETRSLRWPDLLHRPEAIRRVGTEPVSVGESRRDVAARFLRMAWPFVPAEDLGGRTPYAVAGTGRGRDAITRLLPGLPDSLRARWPEFPDLDESELTDILVPTTRAAKEIAKPHPKPTRSRRV